MKLSLNWQVGLGQLYYQGGRGVAVDYELAFHYFSLAAAGGNSNAEAYLGRIYADGAGSIEKNYDTAFKWLSRSAEQVSMTPWHLFSMNAKLCKSLEEVRAWRTESRLSFENRQRLWG